MGARAAMPEQTIRVVASLLKAVEASLERAALVARRGPLGRALRDAADCPDLEADVARPPAAAAHRVRARALHAAPDEAGVGADRPHLETYRRRRGRRRRDREL